MERVLKPMFRGRQATSAFVAGVDITVEMLLLYSSGKAYTGKTIWKMATKVQRSVKKAMLLIRKIDFVTVDRSGAIVQYASGRTPQQFFQEIDNGMFTMLVPERKNPPEKDVATKSCPVTEISIVQEDEDDSAGERAAPIEPATIDDELWGALVETWEPGNSAAPDGFVWFGKFSFYCFGPAAEDKKYFSPTLKLGIMSGTSPESRRALGRLNQRKSAAVRDNANRNAGGDERGMSLNLKMSAGLIAQNEDVNAQQDRNLKVVSLSKQIDVAQKALDFKERMMTAMEMDKEEKRAVYKEMTELLNKIQRLSDDMAQLTDERRRMNPIVESVLQHASTSMGVRASKPYEMDEHAFVESLLNE